MRRRARLCFAGKAWLRTRGTRLSEATTLTTTDWTTTNHWRRPRCHRRLVCTRMSMLTRDRQAKVELTRGAFRRPRFLPRTQPSRAKRAHVWTTNPPLVVAAVVACRREQEEEGDTEKEEDREDRGRTAQGMSSCARAVVHNCSCSSYSCSFLTRTNKRCSNKCQS